MPTKRKAPAAPPPPGIAWTEAEWVRLAQAWVRDEALRPQASLPDRWKTLVPQVFPPHRQRPLPKAKLEGRAKPLFELLPRVRKEQRAALTSAIGLEPNPRTPPLSEDLSAQPEASIGSSLPQREEVLPSDKVEARPVGSLPQPVQATSAGVEKDGAISNSPTAAEPPVIDAAAPANALAQAGEEDSTAAKRRRIFWTYDERLSFVRVYALLEHEHPRMPASTRVDKAQDHLLAMGELKPDRRRSANPTVLLQSPDLKPMLEQARRDLQEELRGQEEARIRAEVAASAIAAVESVPAPSAALGGSNQVNGSGREALASSALSALGEEQGEAPVAAGAHASGPLPSGLKLLSLAAGAFLSEALASPRVQQALALSLAPLMRQAVIDVLNGPPLPVQSGPASTQLPQGGSEPARGQGPVFESAPKPAELRPPKKRLLVVGLLGSQQKEIMAGFSDTFDLRFLTQDDSSVRMEQHAKGCDVTIGMVGYMSHAAEKHLKKAASDYRRCNGTVSELRRMLHGLTH